MALWGTKDTVYSTGKVNCTTAGVLTKQSGSINFNTSCKVGMVVTLATDGAGVGEGVIKSIDSNTQMTLTNLNLPGAFTNVDYEVREKPVFTVGDSNYGANEIFGVDVAEAEAAADDNSQYAPAHAGWVGITSYTDMHGNQRVKTEVLVAGSSISADASDDTILPDS